MRPLRSPCPCTVRGIRTRPDLMPCSDKAMTACAVRARAPAGPSGSSSSCSVDSVPELVGVPEEAKKAFPVPQDGLELLEEAHLVLDGLVELVEVEGERQVRARIGRGGLR